MYSFNEIIGNENIIKNLKNSIKNNKVSHFYIIDGKEKTGKELIAKSFAKLLLCENSDIEPCLKCSSCLSFDTNNNPDFFFIDGSKKNIGVSEIRDNIINNIKTKPFKYKYKVFILKDAHKMTIQAQNAILKTVEDPPSFAIFIMLSKNHKIFLPTIISRSVLFRIKPLSKEDIEGYLLKQGISQTMVRFYFAYSFGSLGRALEIINDNSFNELREEILKDIEKFEDINLINLYKLIEKYENKKDDIDRILDIYLMVYRDALILKNTNNFNKLIQKDIDKLIQNLSKLSIKNLLGKIENILKTKQYLKQNINYNMSIENLFFKLKEKDND